MTKTAIYVRTRDNSEVENITNFNKKLYPLILAAHNLNLEITNTYIDNNDRIDNFIYFLQTIYPEIKFIILSKADKIFFMREQYKKSLNLDFEIIYC